MVSEIEVLNQAGYDISNEQFNKLKERHPYIGEKLILYLVNSINVVARDLNNSAKGKEKGLSRVWDGISGSSKKRQNIINENVIEGLSGVSKWLIEHNKHLGRVDQRIKDVADELYNTQDEIIKFYKEFKEVDLKVEVLEEFRKSATNRFNNIEKRLTRVEAHQHIDREIIKIGTLNLPIELEIFTILDNLVSGEAGLYYFQEENITNKKEFLTYIKNKIKDKLARKDLNKLINHKELILEFNKLEDIEKKAIGFISSQYSTFSSDSSIYDIIDLLKVISNSSLENAENEIDNHSSIRTFVTLEELLTI